MSDSGVNDQTMPQGQTNPAPLASPGAKLAAYREERGWTIEQVASQLNLAPRQIVAIESDDHAALPGMPIVRGFIRQYAKLLKVDPAPLLAAVVEDAAVDSSIAPRKALATPFSEARLPSMMDRTGAQFKWLAGVLLIALLAAGVWAWLQGNDWAGLSKAATSQVKDGLAQMSNNASVPQLMAATKDELPQKSESLKEVPALQMPSAAESVPAPHAGPNAESPAPMSMSADVPTPSPTQPAPSATLRESGKDSLVLKARQDSWIEIRRVANNSAIVSRILKAGESESVEISEPVSVVVGNVSAVDASLRGSPIELKAGGASNVARLTVK